MTWVLRAGFGLLALVLLAVIANGKASDAYDAQVLRWMEEAEPIVLDGETFPGARASAMFDHEATRLESLSFTLRLRCTPARDPKLFAFFDGLVADGPGDRASGGVLRLRRADARAHLAFRQRGTSTLVFDGRYDARHLTGAASTRVTLSDGAVCRADDVPVRLAAPAP